MSFFIYNTTKEGDAGAIFQLLGNIFHGIIKKPQNIFLAMQLNLQTVVWLGALHVVLLTGGLIGFHYWQDVQKASLQNHPVTLQP